MAGNRDEDLGGPLGYGAVEYAYSLMAKEAGIDMTECRLFEEADRHHFMTRRFDRTEDGKKLHMLSLAALAHLDYNVAGAHGYEQALQAIRRSASGWTRSSSSFGGWSSTSLARNQDDHVKNVAFLMDKQGRWSLSPAFDVNYAFNPSGEWTASHQMTVNGKRDGFALADFEAVARAASMKRGRAATIHDEVRATVSRWMDFAARAGVDEQRAERIRAALRLELPSE